MKRKYIPQHMEKKSKNYKKHPQPVLLLALALSLIAGLLPTAVLAESEDPGISELYSETSVTETAVTSETTGTEEIAGFPLNSINSGGNYSRILNKELNFYDYVTKLTDDEAKGVLRRVTGSEEDLDDPVGDGESLSNTDQLIQYYFFKLTEEQVEEISKNGYDTKYLIQVPPNFNLTSSSDESIPLYMYSGGHKTEDIFGYLTIDRSGKVYVTFNEEIISPTGKYKQLESAYVAVACQVNPDYPYAGDAEGEDQEKNNSFSVQFADGSTLNYKRKELEEEQPAVLNKSFSEWENGKNLKSERKIKWTIEYTPYRKSSKKDFTITDTFDSRLQKYVDGTLSIKYKDGTDVIGYTNSITDGKIEISNIDSIEDTVYITYYTEYNADLILPDASYSGTELKNTASLSAQDKDGNPADTIESSASTWVSRSGIFKSCEVDEKNRTVKWTVSFDATGLDGSIELDLTDTLNSKYLKYEEGSLKYKSGGSYVSISPEVTTVSDDTKLVFSIKDKPSDNKYEIVYYTKISDDAITEDINELGTNTVNGTLKYNSEEHTIASNTATAYLWSSIVDKSGVYDMDDTITWTLQVNPNKADLGSAVITDTLPDGLEFDKSSVTPSGTSFTVDGQKITFTLNNVGEKTVEITYKTKITDKSKSDFTNSVHVEYKIKGNENERKYDTSARVPITSEGISKYAEAYDWNDGTIQWQINVDPDRKNVYITDTLPDGLSYVEGSMMYRYWPPDTKIPVEISNNGKTLKVHLDYGSIITYKTKVDVDKFPQLAEGRSVTIVNTAKMTSDKNSKESEASAGYTMQYWGNDGDKNSIKMAKKYGDYKYGDTINYSVEMNPYGAKIEDVTLEDTFAEGLELDEDSVKLYKADVKADSGYQYRFEASNTEIAYKDLKVSGNTFSLNIPECSDPLILRYDMQVKDKDKEAEFSNNIAMKIKGEEANSGKSDEKTKYKYISQQGYFGGGGGASGDHIGSDPAASVAITKTDSEDNSILLDGVEFTLTSSSGSTLSAKTENGKVKFSDLSAGTYVLTETRSAENYNAETIKLVRSSSNKKVKQDGQEIKITLNEGDDVTLTITNEKETAGGSQSSTSPKGENNGGSQSSTSPTGGGGQSGKPTDGSQGSNSTGGGDKNSSSSSGSQSGGNTPVAPSEMVSDNGGGNKPVENVSASSIVKDAGELLDNYSFVPIIIMAGVFVTALIIFLRKRQK